MVVDELEEEQCVVAEKLEDLVEKCMVEEEEPKECVAAEELKDPEELADPEA